MHNFFFASYTSKAMTNDLTDPSFICMDRSTWTHKRSCRQWNIEAKHVEVTTLINDLT